MLSQQPVLIRDIRPSFGLVVLYLMTFGDMIVELWDNLAWSHLAAVVS